MKLAELCEGVPIRAIEGEADVEIGELAYDSRLVGPGTLFFAVGGLISDGHDYAPAAVRAGAAALVVERPLGLGVPEVVVDDGRAAMAAFAARFFGRPTEHLALAAVTGTNGKTTTAFLLRSILERAGVRCGLLGTVKQLIGGEEAEAKRTTPEAIDLQRIFAAMLAAGDQACAMEISSHGLVLGRADASRVRAAAFTNLSQDHLDFHSDMEDYYAAKRSLFSGVEDRREPPETSAINIDDPYGQRLAADLADVDTRLVTFSPSGAPADLSATDVDYGAGGSSFVLHAGDRRLAVSLALPGLFNVENALAALALADALGIAIEQAVESLAGAEPVPGRMEPIDEGQGFSVLVDYAHTPEALHNVLTAARRLTASRLISVVGCGGDRDREKRPLMGGAGATLSDLCVVTSDNPRSEAPAAIIEDILAGIDDRSTVLVEEDRSEAIGLALGRAGARDLVVIAGKGHEQGQEFEGGRTIPFDDRVVARERLRAILAGA